MRKQILFWLTTLLPVLVHAQYTDRDTTEIIAIMDKSGGLAFNNPDSGILVMNKMLAASKDLNFIKGIWRANNNLAYCYQSKGDYAHAMYYALEVSNSFDEDDPRRNILRGVPQILGEIYTDLGDYERAISFYKERLEYVLEHHQENWMAIGNLEFNLARIYDYADQLDSAKVYAEKVFHAYGKIWSSPVVILGEVYVKMSRYEDALKVLNTKATSANFEIDMVDNYIARANAFWYLNKIDSSRFYALAALDVATKRNFLKGIKKASEALAASYENSDRELHFKYLKISYTARDSLYSREKINQVNSFILSDEIRQRDLAAAQEAYQNQTRTFILLGLTAFLTLIGLVLWRISHVKTKSNRLLKNEKEKVEQALSTLKSTQSQLIQSEKMASLGELTVGIAHEIQNPLNFVNNFSEVNTELIEEAAQENKKGNTHEVEIILKDIKDNSDKINHHGKRADAIVKGMLQHSRARSGQKELTDINALCDEYLRLAFHGFRAKDKFLPDGQTGFNAKFETHLDPTLPKVNVVPQDVGRVILNLINNAFYAVTLRQQKGDESYQPTVWVSTQELYDKILISIKDNGPGIPDSIKEKIFQPFFTTKPTGQGTGLGLSLSYDIVKAHGGELKVETKEGEGSEFVIKLPTQS